MVVSEGTKTEPEYLRLVNRRARDALIELVIVDEAATSPKELVERACAVMSQSKKEARRTRDPNAKVDEIWCIFDVDEHPMLKEARQQADANEVQVAISNPCIELWFLLHFDSQAAYLHRSEARRRLQGHIREYDKGFDTLADLEGKYETARSRAQSLRAKHEGDGTQFPEDNPSTDVWRLVDSLQAGY